MTVSVVVPARNAGSYIEEALVSILDQDYADLDVIVVDDGSTDDTGERTARYAPRVHYYRQDSSGGYPGVPRNEGMRKSTGEYICFLDADDIMVPGRLRRQVAFLREHPQVGVVFTDYRNFTVEGVVSQSHFDTCTELRQSLANATSLVLRSEEATALLIQENFGIPSAMMIRRGVLESVPGFSTELQTSEDFHFHYRVARRYSVGVIAEVGALKRSHKDNLTRNILKARRNYIASRTDLRNSETNPENVKLFNRMLHKCEIDLAQEYANRRQFGRSIIHNFRAVVGFRSMSLAHLELAVRTLARTAAIAARLKKPLPW